MKGEGPALTAVGTKFPGLPPGVATVSDKASSSLDKALMQVGGVGTSSMTRLWFPSGEVGINL